MVRKSGRPANNQRSNVRGDRGRRFKRLSPEVYTKNSALITLTMNEFLVSYLLRIYHAFHGDILQAMVLGAIAHHNVSVLSRQHGYDGARINKAIAASGEEAVLAPCNAFSISQATGIPRETVRRKIASLVDKGWVKRDARSQLFLTDAPAAEFGTFTYETADEFLDTAQRILHGCEKKDSSAG